MPPKSCSMTEVSPPRQKALILTQFYPPETGAASMRVAAVVNELAARGYDVTVVAALPSFPSGEVDRNYRGRLLVGEQAGNVRLVRLWTYASPRLSRFDRLLNWATFAFSLTLYLFIQRQRFDLIYTSIGPITLIPPALIAKRLHKARLIADVRDVLPDRALHLKLWREHGPTTKIVTFIVTQFYAAADIIATVNRTCRDEILARCKLSKQVIIFPNGFDPIVPAQAPPFRRRDGEFISSYVGNICQTSGVDVILKAAKHLRNNPRFRFVIVGGGNETAQLEAIIRKDSLDNVVMLGVRPPDEAAAAILASDVCIIPLRSDVVDTIPKKLYDALGLGKPVIVCANGLARQFITEAGGGVCVDPQDGLTLSDAIVRFADDPNALAQFGSNGKAFVAGRFDRRHLVKEFADCIAGTNGRPEPAQTAAAASR